ncbi:MAG TPA: MFS transporter [Gaiellaceae bacterium]|nr:MFS transporter [Gaiellaceae bacterium]
MKQRAVGPSAALGLIRHRNFGPYFVGNAASASGTWFQNLAAQLFVYRQTHSPFLLGVLNFGNFIPVLVLAPWAGSAADRFDRRRLVLATQLGSTALSALLAVLAWTGRAPVWAVIACALGLGVWSAFSAPASQALIADLVPRSELQSAVALNSMTYNLARAVGPALAALSVKHLGIPASFAINSGSYLLLVVGVLVVRTAPRRRAGREETRLRESLQLVLAQPRLLAFLLIVTAVGFASDPINTEAPAFARTFGKPDTWSGVLIGAFGVGAVAAAFLLAGRVAGSSRRMFLTLSLLGGGAIALSLSPYLPAALVFLVVAGFGYLASNTSATSRLQLEVEEHQRGRIMALWSVASLGLRPVASLADGALAGAFGVRAAGVCLALPVLLGAVALVVAGRLRNPAAPSRRRRIFTT